MSLSGRIRSARRWSPNSTPASLEPDGEVTDTRPGIDPSDRLLQREGSALMGDHDMYMACTVFHADHRPPGSGWRNLA